MRYFVTGATGFIGGRLAKQLGEAGHEVIALVRRPEKAAHLEKLGVQLAPGDITDRNSLRASMTGVDGVFHVAGWYKVGAPKTDAGVKVNIEGTRNVLEIMKDLGIPKGVYTSTLAVNSDTRGRLVDENYRYDGPHITEYDRTKWAAHYQVAEPMMNAGLPLVIVMPGVVYGPGDTSPMHDTLLQYLQGKLPTVPQGLMNSWAHVDDVARAHILAMEKGRAGESYIICGETHRLIDVIRLAEQITGVPAPRAQYPPAVFRVLAALAGLIEHFATLPGSFSSEILRTGAGITYIGDNSKARRELGYDPRPLEAILREALPYDLGELEIRPS